MVSKEEDGKRGGGGKRERGEKEFGVSSKRIKVYLGNQINVHSKIAK